MKGYACCFAPTDASVNHRLSGETDCAAYLEPWRSSAKELRYVRMTKPVTAAVCASGDVPFANCTVREGLL